MESSNKEPLESLREALAARGMVSFRDGCFLTVKNSNLGKFCEARASLFIDEVFRVSLAEYGCTFYDLPAYARPWAASAALRVYLREYPEATMDGVERGVRLLNEHLTKRGLLTMATDEVLAGE